MKNPKRALRTRSIALLAGCALAACSSTAGDSRGGSTTDATSTGAAGSSTSGAGGATGSTSTSTDTSTTTGQGGSSATGGSGGAGGTGGAGGSATRDAGPLPDASGICAAGGDPLKTNGARVDAYDCLLVTLAQMNMHPDPMMVKAQVQQESSFDVFATSADSPCGTKAGWTDAESKSFGLVQVTPACGEAKSALMSDGHPNLTKDMTAPTWSTSVFNPELNLGEGFKTITTMLRSLKSKYAGCTDAQYVLMSAGAFNSGTSAVLGCGMFNARAQTYVNLVLGHYHGFARSAGWPDPY